MKATFDVTIFHNGDIDILHASVYQELWKDYETFKQRSVRQREKNTAKGNFLARRYERAALQALFAFFISVVDMWMMQIARHHKEYEESLGSALWEKCAAVQAYAAACSRMEICYDSEDLQVYLQRYENHDLSLLEYVTYDMLCSIEEKMDIFLVLIEGGTGMKRFPEPDPSTEALVHSLAEAGKNTLV